MLAEETQFGTIVFWCLLMIVVAIAACYGALMLRRRMLGDDMDSTPGAGAGLTLMDLRELHDEGKLTDAEFEKAKHAIVEATKRKAARDVAAKAEGGLGGTGGGKPVVPFARRNPNGRNVEDL